MSSTTPDMSPSAKELRERRHGSKRATLSQAHATMTAGMAVDAAPPLPSEVSSLEELQAILKNFKQTAAFDDTIVAARPQQRTRSATVSLADDDETRKSIAKAAATGSRKARSRATSRQSSRQHSPERPPPPSTPPPKPAPPSSAPAPDAPASKVLRSSSVIDLAATSPANDLRIASGGGSRAALSRTISVLPKIPAPSGAAPRRPVPPLSFPSSLPALALSPRGVVDPGVIADATSSSSPPPSSSSASSSATTLSPTTTNSKRQCPLCRQRFATSVALNQHVRQLHTCAQCSETTRVAYRVDADGAARRLCSKCAVSELLGAAVPGTPRTASSSGASENGVAPIAPVAPLSPRSVYAQAVLQARVRASAAPRELSTSGKMRRGTRTGTEGSATPPPLPSDQAIAK
jgi:hypothetical protein